MRALGIKFLDMAELIDCIGAGNPDPRVSGDTPLVLATWVPDGRVITARYCKDSYETADVDIKTDVCMDDELIRPHAEALIKEGKAVRVLMGSHDDTQFLIWTIE